MAKAGASGKREIHNIPAGIPFARALVTGIMALADDPADLASALVLVPSRRAARALRLAFLEVKADTAMLLPRLVPIGDVDDDDPALFSHDFHQPLGSGQSDAIADVVALPPAINPSRRQILLARLLSGFSLGGQRPTFSQAMMLARALADLLDQVASTGADLAQLRGMLPDRFSQHWQDILALLNILIDRWPDILAAEGVMDGAVRREVLAQARIASWRSCPPEGLVVVAGSTGTFASTRDLIACVADLPRGYVVLPGLDDEAIAQWPEISRDAGHPQHQLAQLLAHLEVGPEAVTQWPELPVGRPICARRRDLMRAVFAPASLTAQWRTLAADRPDLSADSLDGLEVIECPDRTVEATLVAMALRETLESPERTAALITPDRALAEAVIIALRRWGIDVDDSAGTPLSQCSAGGFLQLLANALAADFAPVALLALLKHPLASGGIQRSDFQAKLGVIERAVLRGHRPGAGLDGLISSLVNHPELAAFVRTHVQAPLADIIAIWKGSVPSLGNLASGLAQAAEHLAARAMTADGACDPDDGALHLWDGFDGAAAAEIMRDLAAEGGDAGIDPVEFPMILGQLFAEKPVRRRWPIHPRLAVLGPVEARMQSADRLILAGFNEGNWPPRLASDPWMNGEMRQAIGLPSRNWRTGLSAHDVYMAIASPEVIVTRAVREGDAVTAPSRWLQRLEAVLASLGLTAALNRGADRLAWVSQLTPDQQMVPQTRPRPCPPVAARPRQFSATEVDSWISDPYSIYAKRVLGLRQLDPVDRPPDAALRGNLVHDALAAFIERFPSGALPDNALAELEAIGKSVFRPQWHEPGVRYFWWPRFLAVAGWFVSQERQRRKMLMTSHAEVEGRVTIAGPAGPVTFTARADRVDQDSDGGLHIIDYKTGSVPTAAQVSAGRRTQLLVESLIAAKGGFDDLKAGPVRAMEYWQLSGRRGRIASQSSVMPDAWTADETRDRLIHLVELFDRPETAYPSEPDRKYAPAYSPFRHLARIAEWQSETDDE